MRSAFIFIITFIFLVQLQAATDAVVHVPELPPQTSAFNPVTMIALASMIISLVSCVLMMFGQRHNASNTYVNQLEKKVEGLEKDLTAANQRIKLLEYNVSQITRENIELLRKLAKVP